MSFNRRDAETQREEELATDGTDDRINADKIKGLDRFLQPENATKIITSIFLSAFIGVHPWRIFPLCVSASPR